MEINVPGTAFNRAMRASKAIRNELEEMVKQRKSDLLQKKASPMQDILSDLLLTTDEHGQFLTKQTLPAIFLMSIMKLLAEHPEVYNEVRREQLVIASAKEPNRLLNWEDTRKMKYSWNITSEVLRLFPPIFGTFREATADFTYAGHTIPRGRKLHWNAYSTHTNPEYFPDPKMFNPSRFEENGPIPCSYVPFGGGPRMCPGTEYARLVILAFMHNVVMKFRWEKLVRDKKVVFRPHTKPEQGLPIRLYPNKP